MSLKVILSVSILLLVFSIKAQLTAPLKRYYTYINKAEFCILDSSYDTAIRYYDSAFASNTQSFAIDLYNGAVCASLNKEYSKCYNWLKIVLQRGYSVETARVNTGLRTFFKHKKGKLLLKECEKEDFLTYNKTLRYSLDSLLERDQLFRIKEGSYSVYSDTIAKIDKSNVVWLNNYIKNYGFPAEWEAGIGDGFGYPYGVILIHQHPGVPDRQYDYSEMLEKAMYDGKINAKNAMWYIDDALGRDKYGVFMFALVKCVLDTIKSENMPFAEKTKKDSILAAKEQWRFFIQRDNRSSEKISANRLAIGQENVDEYKKKIVFNLKDARFKLSFGSSSIYSWNTLEDYERAIKFSIIAE